MTWGLVRGNTVGWLSGEVTGALLVGLTLLGTFVRWERRTADPMLPLALFRSRGFTAANAVSFFMYAGLFGALFLMAQLLQTALGYSPLQAGLRLLPWTLPPMFIAPLAGALADRYGNRPFMVLGLALQAAGYAWVASIAAPGMDYTWLGVAFAVAGVGISFCFPAVANAVMGSVAMEEAGAASGTNSAMRELGGVFGVAVLAAVCEVRLLRLRPGVHRRVQCGFVGRRGTLSARHRGRSADGSTCAYRRSSGDSRAGPGGERGCSIEQSGGAFRTSVATGRVQRGYL